LIFACVSWTLISIAAASDSVALAADSEADWLPAAWAVAAATIPRLACAAINITRTIRIPTRLQTTSRNESWPGASIGLSALRFTATSHRRTGLSIHGGPALASLAGPTLQVIS